MENIRRQFIQGIEPKACRACWEEEQSGIDSMRIIRERYYGEQYKDRFDHPQICSLDLKFSTLCNLKCRICGPYLSSSWLKEAHDVGNTSNDLLEKFSRNTERKFGMIDQNLEIFERLLPSMQVIEFHGGEPFMQPEHRIFLEIIDRSTVSDELILIYNTNGTHYDPRFTEIWKKISKVILNFSVDDLHHRFEYQRYPAKWDEVMANIRKYRENSNDNVKINFYTTVSLYNIFYLNEFINHNMMISKLPILLNMVHFPESMNIRNLPSEIKVNVLDKLNRLSDEALSYLISTNTIESITNYMMVDPDDPTAMENFLNTTKTHDRYREQDFSSVFPEYSSMIDRSLSK
jgi:MoaA/NifB/PqqE/SkfB family radical SAM enzyme